MERESRFYVECLDSFTNESIVNYLSEKRGHIPKEEIFDNHENSHLVYPVECRDVTFFQESKKKGLPLRFNVFRLRGNRNIGAEMWNFHTKQKPTAEQKRVKTRLQEIAEQKKKS